MDYQAYLHMPSTPAGAILDHILTRLRISQATVARGVGIIPQRVYDLIKGNRRFTPPLSLAIEKYLGIDVKGLFYHAQTNHDLFLAEQKIEEQDLSTVLRESLFWEYDLSKLLPQKDKGLIICRVMEYGTKEDVRGLLSLYSPSEIIAVAKSISAPRHPEILSRNLQFLLSL